MGLSVELEHLCNLPFDGEINTLTELKRYHKLLKSEVYCMPEEADYICIKLDEIMRDTVRSIFNSEWVNIHGAALYLSRTVTDWI